MCDSSPVRNWLFGLIAALVLAAAAVGAAMIANGSLWLIWTSAGWMIVAGLLTLGAIGLCVDAGLALDKFCSCAGTSCEDPCGNKRRLISAIEAVLGIQATACFTVAIIASIPWLPLGLMAIIIWALIAQLLLAISLIPFYASLTSCQISSAQPM